MSASFSNKSRPAFGVRVPKFGPHCTLLKFGNWKRKDWEKTFLFASSTRHQLFGSHRFCFVILTSHFVPDSEFCFSICAPLYLYFVFLPIFLCIWFPSRIPFRCFRCFCSSFKLHLLFQSVCFLHLSSLLLLPCWMVLLRCIQRLGLWGLPPSSSNTIFQILLKERAEWIAQYVTKIGTVPDLQDDIHSFWLPRLLCPPYLWFSKKMRISAEKIGQVLT